MATGYLRCCCVLVLLTSSCTSSQWRSHNEGVKGTVGQVVGMPEAVRLAVDRLKQEGMDLHQESRLTIAGGDGLWCCWFVFFPLSPGNDISVFVDEYGRTEILPGF